jgi:hypothetical protein
VLRGAKSLLIQDSIFKSILPFFVQAGVNEAVLEMRRAKAAGSPPCDGHSPLRELSQESSKSSKIGDYRSSSLTCALSLCPVRTLDGLF